MKKNSTVRIAEQKAKEADAKVVQARANYFPEAINQTNAIHASQTDFMTIPAGMRSERTAPPDRSQVTT